MGVFMSLAFTLRRVAAPATLAITTVFAAANANAADYGCYAPDKVPALQQQVLKAEGMVPVAARFTALNATEYVQEAIMMNPSTREGLRWEKDSNGKVCIFTKYRDMQLFNNKAFDQKAFYNINGKPDNQVEINQVITNVAFKKGEFPMFRGIATTPTNAAMGHPTEYVEYMLGHPTSKMGGVIAANLSGEWMKSFTKAIPSPSQANVKFGAIYTEVGEDLIARSVPATIALNQN